MFGALINYMSALSAPERNPEDSFEERPCTYEYAPNTHTHKHTQTKKESEEKKKSRSHTPHFSINMTQLEGRGAGITAEFSSSSSPMVLNNDSTTRKEMAIPWPKSRARIKNKWLKDIVLRIASALACINISVQEAED